MAVVQAPQSGFWAVVCATPVVMLWLLLTLLALPLTTALGGVVVPGVQWFYMLDPSHTGGDVLTALRQAVAGGEVWRLVSPAFLHFGLMHVLFNAALFYVLGIRLELRLGSVLLMVVLLGWAALSNATQLVASGHANFGGLSGVVYAMLGAVFVLGLLRKRDPVWALPPGLFVSLLVFLLIFSTGITENFGLHVANAAHWGGLVSGVLTGFAAHWLLPHEKAT